MGILEFFSDLPRKTSPGHGVLARAAALATTFAGEAQKDAQKGRVHQFLGCGIPTLLKKYEFVNWDDEIPN